MNVTIRGSQRNDFLGPCECLKGPENRRLLQFCRNKAKWLEFSDGLEAFRLCGVHHNALQSGSIVRVKRPGLPIRRLWKGLVDLSRERTRNDG